MDESVENAIIMSSDEILQSKGVTEYTVSDIIKDFEDAYAYKTEQARIFKILDAADHSDVWKTFNRRIPAYMQTPTHNPITIIKEATKASIMPTSFQGEFRAKTIQARELAKVCTKYFNMKWDATDMDSINSDVADYAFLLGTGIVLFGWNKNIIDIGDVTNYFNPAKHAEMQAKAWHPSNVFPDPSANDIEEMSYLFFVERKSKKFLKRISRFRQAIENIENANDVYGNVANVVRNDQSKQTMSDTVTFITCYRRVDRTFIDPTTGIKTVSPKVDIIYLAGRNVLDVEPNIEPNMIPAVPLYDERIPNEFWGIGKPQKVLSLVLTLNQLDSIEATSYFQNQNPAEFINALSGLNVSDYQRRKNGPNSAFTVNCDPKVVQEFAKRPDLPKTLDGFRSYLLEEIANISGVDAAYLGRSYGSIQTTGGVEQAVDRATMRDNNRIKAIDKFIRKEIEIMCQFYMIHGQAEDFLPPSAVSGRDQASQALHFDPQQLIARDDIEISVSNAAPRSNQSYEDSALQLLELQMKYDPQAHGYPDFITPEELIACLNIPKTLQNTITERMSEQLQNLKIEEYTGVIMAFGQLVDGGMDPEMALQLIANQIEQSSVGQLPATTGLGAGNINGAMSPVNQQ